MAVKGGVECFARLRDSHVKDLSPPTPISKTTRHFRSYKTYSQRGQQIFFAKETSSVLCRCVCKNNRSFIMHVMNPDQSVFMIIERSVHLYMSSKVEARDRAQPFARTPAHLEHALSCGMVRPSHMWRINASHLARYLVARACVSVRADGRACGRVRAGVLVRERGERGSVESLNSLAKV